MNKPVLFSGSSGKTIAGDFQLLQTVLDASLDTIQVFKAIKDTDGVVVDFEWLFYNRPDRRDLLVGKQWTEHYNGETRNEVFNACKQVMETGETADFEWHNPENGEDKWYHVSIIKLDDNIVVTKQDITEEKHAKDELEASKHFIEQVMNTTPDFIYVLDIQKKSILFINDRATEIFGMSKDEIYEAGSSIIQRMVHADDLERKMEHLAAMERLQPDDVKELEVRLKLKTGEWHWFCVRDTVFKRNDNGLVLQTIGIGKDIQEQKIAERQLINKNRELESLNTELKTFNSVAVHDFKETFKKVYTSLEFIVSHDARYLSNEGRANIRRVQSAIQKVKLLTDDIENYSKIHDFVVNISMVDSELILRKVLHELNEQIVAANATVETTNFPLLPADPVLLGSLFYNLVENAIKFRKQVAPPVIKIRYSQADEINFEPDAIRNTPYAIISISDNGIGFSEEESEKIFNMFYRLHEKSNYKGSGIGLTICKKIMMLHNGFIRAEGIPAHGATFNCYFPLEKV